MQCPKCVDWVEEWSELGRTSSQSDEELNNWNNCRYCELPWQCLSGLRWPDRRRILEDPWEVARICEEGMDEARMRRRPWEDYCRSAIILVSSSYDWALGGTDIGPFVAALIIILTISRAPRGENGGGWRQSWQMGIQRENEWFNEVSVPIPNFIVHRSVDFPAAGTR